MQAKLKKSLYVGLAALTFASVAGTANANAAEKTNGKNDTAKISNNKKATSKKQVAEKQTAKKVAPKKKVAKKTEPKKVAPKKEKVYPTFEYNDLEFDAAKANVNATGTAGLYTKPSSRKGARLVVSKAKMGQLGNSKNMGNTFYVDAMAKNSNGTLYARVTSMNKQYRGWIYAGRTDFSNDLSQITGGVNYYETMTPAALPSQTDGYYLKGALWTTPWRTQKDSAKVGLESASGYSNTDTFRIDNATTVRSGALYYHVVDNNMPSLTGWVYSGNLSGSMTADLGYTIRYVDQATGSTVDTKTVPLTALGQMSNGNTIQFTTDLANKFIPTGYKVSSLGNVDNVKAGGNGLVYVTKYNASQLKLNVLGDGITGQTPLTGNDVTSIPNLTANQISSLSGKQGTPITMSDIEKQLFNTGAPLNKFDGKTVTDDNGKTYYYYEYTYNSAMTNQANAKANYGDTLNIYYNRTKVATTNPTSQQNTNAGNQDYLAK
ncbi:hypothetical protein M2S00_06395 [Apilactobacillus sp. TMW 2.2459]|uniref:hypothetical protein n=1 Tax=Apilactobacillus xinyiensis TaxID=2841032 RepID=UPI001C7CF855|nr:hypothetical protein [Apilactobacillus xinyiensis]MCL0312732.1 hypothetical protein [Apilactobacillus xinyiensis]